ncbi:LytR/AlgR family response regulator transcription factor [Chromobacterium violaceum]|uniref:Probable two-component system, regulatory protein n=1 Tax=Chromobacterium violaceum (strain ATCC 12472 / DSM 30191 / JCM 1249 / CCUG 213 / NBRC 12614 / NCIMB 9131 / NCTC 9757 / MK) TaxID=243365 RepID=Q7P1K6_CHRVO|nr:LytTR family DNA-binding domain-containing protein [Chromobacterium violaceum]AAQ57886.1 probable two-component system, regulatory protein [Chromobacterium violaceum ATCC 12472]SUX40527.1 Sensory transduction protein lytR [Chromobacterium violaceum]
MGALSALRALVVDDEALACDRLRQLLADCGVEQVDCLADGQAALDWLARHPVDVLLLDISMPGLDGISLARQLRQQALAPALVFSTAHDHFAVEAFELDAADYLLKPVRRERLEQALRRALARRQGQPQTSFTVRQRGRLLNVPFADARYLKAELKYVTLVTPDSEYLLDDALVALEQRLGDSALRIHRNCLVMRHAVQELCRGGENDGDEQWIVRLRDIPAPLPVSRRQIHALRAALSVSN